MQSKRFLYKSEQITVSYEPKICIHAAECVKGLPGVFNTENKPWVSPENASPVEIAAVINKCPSGALKYVRNDTGNDETTTELASVKITKNGPLYFRGDIELSDEEGNIIYEEKRIAVCRCGGSKNKPFCDNTHKEVNFIG